MHNQHSDTEELGKTKSDHVFTFFMLPAVQAEFCLVKRWWLEALQSPQLASPQLAAVVMIVHLLIRLHRLAAEVVRRLMAVRPPQAFEALRH